MSTQTIYRYIFILSLCLSVLSGAQPVYAQADTTAEEDDGEPPERKKYAAGHQLVFGIDLLHPVLNNYDKNRYTYEATATYYLKNEYYAVAEGGWGGSNVTYTDLRYTTTNYFGRIGFNKSILYRESETDWDMMFIGLRGAISNVSRGSASYIVVDSLWGNSTGISPAKAFIAGWAEITLGMRVELLHGVMAGWNMRSKFMMNGRSFKDLAPLNIAGFGRGDKNASFDFNFYIDYAIRWKRKGSEEKKPDVKK